MADLADREIMPVKEHSFKRYDQELDDIRGRVLQMGGLVERQIHEAIRALATGDLQLMEQVDRADHGVNAREVGIDRKFQMIARELVTYMIEDPRLISMAFEILFMAKALERIGDHAKNIAEQIIFIAHGTDVRHIAFEQLEHEATGPGGSA